MRHLITDERDIFAVMAQLNKLNLADGPYEIVAKRWFKQRTRNANSLYWKWLAQIATRCSARTGAEFESDYFHNTFRHQYLGYTEPPRVALDQLGMVPEPILVSTTSLDTPSMCDYMTNVDIWAMERDILLPTPARNEYAAYREAQR